jgi:hypothetical protein
MKVKMFSTNNQFEDTIFNNDKVVVQSECFQYSHILIPLNTNLDLTLLVWGKLYSVDD